MKMKFTKNIAFGLVLFLMSILPISNMRAQSSGDFGIVDNGPIITADFFNPTTWGIWNTINWGYNSEGSVPSTPFTKNVYMMSRTENRVRASTPINTGSKALYLGNTFTTSSTLTIGNGGQMLNSGGGTFNQTAGDLVINGTLTNRGTINKSGGAIIINGSFINYGELNITGGSGVIINPGGTLTNNSTYFNHTAGDITNAGTLNNSGTITSSGGTVSSSGTLTNTGTINRTDDFTITSGTFTNNGTLSRIASGIFTFSGTYQGTGSYIGEDTFTNTGTLSPGTVGTVGTLVVARPFTNSATLTIDLPSEVSFDVINVTGAAAINGVINATFGFRPIIGARFKIITGTGTRTGAATVNVISLSENSVSARYDGATGEIEIVRDLSIELSKFEVKNNKTAALLTWVTASEKNNALFNIEHSANGVDFKAIGEMKGNGTTNTTTEYNYEHSTPSVGVNYYRLKQTDFNGASTYSAVRSLLFGQSGLVVKSTLVQNALEIIVSNERATTVNIFNATGQQVMSNKIQGEYSLDVSALPSGLYFIRTTTGDKGRFVKQ